MAAAWDDERLTLVGLLVETQAGVVRAVDRHLETECGLSSQWFEVLLRLARSPGHRLRMADLAAQVTLTPSGLTRAVDRLVETGLVRREVCHEDRRGAWATLTQAGRRRIAAAVPVHLAHVEREVLAPLDGEERRSLAVLLRLLRDHVNPAATTAITGA